MSNTRRADKAAPFRQERFASSAEFERGLLGNLVAKRCELLGNAKDRALIWWLQLRSWQDGGLAKLAAELIAAFPERIVTETMQKVGFKSGQLYSAEMVKVLREEIPHQKEPPFYPLKGEVRHKKIVEWMSYDDEEEIRAREVEAAEKLPTRYPASDFINECLNAARNELQQALADMCLNPQIDIAYCDTWYFPGLVETLREVMDASIESTRAGAVVTKLGRQVHETLDYCQQARCMVLIDGLARTGKTHSVKLWCDLRPGSARYVQVPSTNDDIGFFRAIARALGVSINQNSKAQQLRDRIEDVLQRGDLTIVFDEAHYLWPQSNYREALPGRINWIMTALVNQRVSVALVTTPQFIRTQKAVEKKSAWTGEQFTGRIGHYEKLPDSLSEKDLSAVAKNLLPEGCSKSIETLVVYAQGSAKYLAAIESVVRRARYLASKTSRAKVIFADIKTAIKESVIPSDTALAVALAEPKKTGRARAISSPVQSHQNALETPLQSDRETRPAIDDCPKHFTASSAIATDRTNGHLVAE